MATIKTLGDAYYLESKLTKTQMEEAKQFYPEALTLKEDKDIIFRVTYSTSVGSIGTNGICFDTSNAEDNLCITDIAELVGKPKDEIKDYIKKNFGLMLLNLNKVETQVLDAAALFKETIDSIDSSISIG